MRSEWLPLALRNKTAQGGGDESRAIPEEALSVLQHYYFGEQHERDPALRRACLENFEKRYGKGHGPEDLTAQVEMTFGG